MRITSKKILIAGLLIGFFLKNVYADTILLQSTTSTANSGLYEVILPIFTASTGIHVHVVASGTGQAITNAMNGDGDVLLVHAKSAEEKFVRDGYGVQRFDVMYNDFVIVGPNNDPADIRGAQNAVKALTHISQNQSIFISRGDNSGTHRKEISLWQMSGIDPLKFSGAWYRETGSGMGATLNIASGMNAYTLTDRATWLNFKNRGHLEILSESDSELFNQYGVVLVNPVLHPKVNVESARKFINWILSADGQLAIASYKIDGQQLFFPNPQP